MAIKESGKARGLAAVFVCMLVWTCGSSISEGAAPKEATMSPAREEVGQKIRGVTRNGALFEAVADRIWKIPAPEDEAGSVVDLALRITNRTETPLRFNKFDTLRLALFAPGGKALPFLGGRNAVRSGEGVSPPLLPGQTLVISRQGRLTRLKDGGLRLIGSEESGGIWYFDGLGPGRYKVQFIYGNARSRIGDLDAFWVGEVATPVVGIELR
jgi:hypothetical protein